MKWTLVVFVVLIGVVEAQEAAQLGRTIRANTAQLEALEGDLAQRQEVLAALEAEILQKQEELTTSQAQLQGEVSRFYVQTRQLLRAAMYPWAVQTVEDVTHGAPNRQLLVQQVTAQMAATQAARREEIQATLAQQLVLAADYRTFAQETASLIQRRTALHRRQQRLLRQLGVADKRLAARLRRALPDAQEIEIGDVGEAAGLHPAPTGAPTDGFLVSDTEDDSRMGVTIQGTAGAPVVAHAAGRVIYSGSYRDFGHLVILDVGANRHDVYAGLGYRQVRVGDTLTDGATVGRLPNTTAPRLYFEQRRGETVLATQF